MTTLPTQSIIEKLLQQIQTGTAEEILSANHNSQAIEIKTDNDFANDLELDQINISSTDLTENIKELFSFIQKNNLAQSMQIVDSEGLAIAEEGDNSLLETLTVSFPQFQQMLEFSEYNSHSSGFWIQLEQNYIITIVEEVNHISYGLMMQCHQLLSAKQTTKIKDLLNAVIKKGVNYE